MDELREVRDEIDHINAEMAQLFKRRMELSVRVAEHKKKNNMAVQDKARERAILEQMEQITGEEFAVYTRTLFSTLFNVSKAYQNKMLATNTAFLDKVRKAREESEQMFPSGAVVACQGAEGAFSQMAADKLFARANILYFNNFEGVFQAVEKGLCRYGVLPIENSSHGSVNEVYDLMQNYNFSIVRTVKLHVNHYLLAKPGAKFENIKEVFSHSQAIGQCGHFLAELQGVKITPCENTAIAAKMVMESGRDDVAAISSENCAELYGLQILKNQIQDVLNNYTRFICVAKDMEIFAGANRISLLLTLPHEPGSLYQMISKFAALGLNLTKLESRPIAGKDFEFMFYFDIEASVWDENVVGLLSELSATKERFVFLGNYSEE